MALIILSDVVAEVSVSLYVCFIIPVSCIFSCLRLQKMGCRSPGDTILLHIDDFKLINFLALPI